MVEIAKQKPLTFTQSNSLIEARYSMTAGELHLIFSVLSMIDRNDSEFQEYTIRIKDLAFLWGISTKYAYKEIDKITDRLLSRVLYLEREDESFLKSNWLASAEYKNGLLTLEISKKLRPYLLKLKREFKSFELMVVLGFKSSYSVRIYMLLKQYENIGVREFDLLEFREILDIDNKKYPQFKHFRQFVITKAKKEFDKKDKDTGLYLSDINFKLETIREGRKISRLRFTIIKQQTKEEIKLIGEKEDRNEENKNSTLEKYKDTQNFKALKLLGIKDKKSLELFEEYGEDKIKEKLEVLEETRKIKEIKSPSGFLLKALKDDYQSKKTVEKQKEEENKKKRAEEAKKQKEKRRRENLKKEFEKEQKETIEQSTKDLPEAILQGLIKQFEGSEKFKKAMESEHTANSYKMHGISKQWGAVAFSGFIKENFLAEELQTFENWLKFKEVKL